MQSVISCLLAIKRIMTERKIISTKKSPEFLTTGRKQNLALLSSASPTSCNNSVYQQKNSALSINKSIANSKTGNRDPSSPFVLSEDSCTKKNKFSTTTPTTNPAAHYLLSATSSKKKATSVPCIPAFKKQDKDDDSLTPDWSKKLSSPTRTHRRSFEYNDSCNTRVSNVTCTEKKISSHQGSKLTAVGVGGGYVKSQVHMITTNNHLSVNPEPSSRSRRFSSSDNTPSSAPTPSSAFRENLHAEAPTSTSTHKRLSSPPMPKPSKSTPLVAASNVTVTASKAASGGEKKMTAESKMKYYTNMENSNRKTSLKKMGSCAITVESDDGTPAVYV
jgi:hypothetical protein